MSVYLKIVPVLTSSNKKKDSPCLQCPRKKALMLHMSSSLKIEIAIATSEMELHRDCSSGNRFSKSTERKSRDAIPFKLKVADLYVACIACVGRKNARKSAYLPVAFVILLPQCLPFTFCNT